MNNRIAFMAGFILFSCSMLAWVGNLQQVALNTRADLSILESEKGRLHYQWKDAVTGISQFSPPIVEPDSTSKVAEMPLTLADGKLIALVADTPQSAMFKLPGQNMPVTLTVGEHWLPDWSLAEIGRDYVVWQQQNTGELQTQYLFEPSNSGKIESEPGK
ncbi:hypothetical protein [Bowmanella yangjiangensis]|uniref:Uncharacterized protein n=1 Tax=Bowmanella yangjiangensis TaxID=2811230 RepID=A0ABS3CTH9_9ALTE|nr:hypothetical protein [Bowmanella yangjiangensis]MBN7820432.1 hypothetical protein [Bowmanella yangjiangensis]